MKTKGHAMIVLGLIFVLSIHNSYSQTICQTPDASINSAGEHIFNQYVIRFKEQGKHLNTDLKIIPVVIHVIYRNSADSQRITMARIRGQIDATNKQLRRLNANANETRKIFLPVAADCNIQMCLATRKPDRSTFSGVIYHKYPDYNERRDLDSIRAATTLNHYRYLNVWVTPDTNTASAVFPWQATAHHDGFYIGSKVFGTIGADLLPSNNLGAIFTHELGHYLGVLHTFDRGSAYLGKCELVNDPSISDFCGDTPLDWDFPNGSEAPTCSYGIREECGGFITQTENYMYYNPDRCLNMFSKDQRARMRACLHSLRFILTLPSNQKLTGVDCKDLNENCNSCSTPLALLGADYNDLQVDKQSMEKKITIFPNPTNSIVHIIYHNLPLKKGMSIDLYNQLGQKLKRVYSNTAINNLSLVSFPDGVYYMNITIDNTSITKYIMKAGR
jgi:hypothetical protein